MEIRILATGLRPPAGRRLRECLTELEMQRGALGWFRGELLLLDNPEDAALAASAEYFDLILLGLDEQRGAPDFLALQRAAPATPVVLVAGDGQEVLAARLIREGAQDYLLASAWPAGDLERTLRNAIERMRVRNGERYQCLYDPGTGLPNRAGFLTYGEPLLRVAARLHGLLLLARGVSPAANPARWQGARRALDAADLLAQIGEDEVAVLAVAEDEAQLASWAAELRAAGIAVWTGPAADGPLLLEDWLSGVAVRE